MNQETTSLERTKKIEKDGTQTYGLGAIITGNRIHQDTGNTRLNIKRL